MQSNHDKRRAFIPVGWWDKWEDRMADRYLAEYRMLEKLRKRHRARKHKGKP